MRFFEHARYDFIGKRSPAYLLSALLVLVSLGAVLIKGLQYGIDFRGGTEMLVMFREPIPLNEVRTVLSREAGYEFRVRQFGSERELQIRTITTEVDMLTERIERALATSYPGNPVSILGTTSIGPVFGEDMQNAAKLATGLSLLVISLYIFFRFRALSFTVAVLVTLMHDMVIIVGLFTLLSGVLPFNMEIDQVLIGAFLTIIGYSLNDTIVVFDRIRENRMLHKGLSWVDTVNKSINQTLSRTVATSLTTFMVVAVLFMFGGEALKGFSFALMIGIALGTYSTIFISCPMLVDISHRREEVKTGRLQVRRKAA